MCTAEASCLSLSLYARSNLFDWTILFVCEEEEEEEGSLFLYAPFFPIPPKGYLMIISA